MSQPPLNPDALEAGHEAYRRAYFKDGAPAPRCFEKGLSAYLAAALPEVTSDKASTWQEGFEAGWAEAKDPGAFVNDVWDAKTPNPHLP